MALEEIITGGIVGILIGGITGFIIPIIMTRLRLKNSIKRIRKQKLTYRLNGKEHDFAGEIDKSLKKNAKNFNEKKDIKADLIPPSPIKKKKKGVSKRGTKKTKIKNNHRTKTTKKKLKQ